MTPIEALIERVEAAQGPDRELDAEIAVAFRPVLPNGTIWHLKFPNWEPVFNGEVRIIGNVNGNGDYIAGTFVSQKYTASIDAAMSLVPEGWRTAMVSEMEHREGWHWRLGWKHDRAPKFGMGGQDGIGATAALALTAAALRARTASREGV